MTRTLPRIDRLPHALYRAEQVRAFDRAAIERHGIPGLELMQRAGAAAWALARARWPEARAMTVLVGGGNNGGDGYVLARLAHAEGCAVRLLSLVDPERLRGDAAACRDAWCAAGGRIEPWTGALPRACDLIVDALLGTGLERPLDGDWRAAVEAINAARAPVLSIDLPSGLHADTGQVLGAAVRASLTLTFIALKQGLFTGQGPEYCGEIRFEGLDLPARIYAGERLSARRIDWARERGQLPPLARTAHKGQRGHVLVIGGAPGFSGAARLAGEAALRAGAGLVTIATHPTHAAVLNLARPELMVHGVESPLDLDPLIERAGVIAVGPGLGRDAWGRALWERVCEEPRALVVDADALNLLAASPRRGADWVLTPHPGEAARLLGVSSAEIERDRFASVRALQGRFGGVVVLKGAGSLIQPDADAPPALCHQGNPGMATAGAGDVLTGVIAALLAQGLESGAAACAGVCLHAAAGDRAALAGERGLIASDIIAALRATCHSD